MSLIKPTPLITLGHGGFHLLSRDDFRLPIWREKWPHAKPLVPHCHSLSFYLYIKNIVSLLKTKGINKKKTDEHEISFKKYDLFPFSTFAIHLFYKLKPLSRFQANYKVKCSFYCMSKDSLCTTSQDLSIPF